jgi:lysyl-tRNA synthetase class 2
MATLKELRDERLRKLEELWQLDVNPYPAKAERTHTLVEVTTKFDELQGQQVSVVGRIVGIRKFGKIAFIVIRDQSGQVQLFLGQDKVASLDAAQSRLGFEQLPLLDTGDFIEAHGPVVKTQTGEISVEVHEFRLLTKSLRPMPLPQEGFTNKEERLRRRYVDMNVNLDVRERFVRRSKFWQATRDFLNQQGFTEVNIPVLEHTTGGADATPFVTHMDALDQDFYLRISHELPLKRLIGAGFEKVYDIGPRFRNENYSDEHLPEHVAFESYAAYQDYEDGMALYEEMMKQVAHTTWGTLQFKVDEFDVNLDQKWPVISYSDIMREKFDVDVFNPDFEQLKRILADHKVQLDGDVNVSRAMDSVWKLVRKESAGPFWLIHEPVTISPLAKQDPGDPRVTQRFHPVIAGTEMGNGYSELNDPVDQLNRFLEQQQLRDSGDSEAQMLDIDFVEMLEYGMPPACGWSYSERFFWAFEGVTAREGVPFPQLRHEIDEGTKAIYPEVYSQSVIGASKAVSTAKSRPQDFSKRIVTVLNKDLEAWQAANAVAHMNAIIGNEIPKNQLVSGDYFVGSDEVAIPRNSQYPIIIMRADEKTLHKLHDRIMDKNLIHHIFIKEMQQTSNDQEITDALQSQPIADTIFYGLTFFAPNELADELTKNLQLWK